MTFRCRERCVTELQTDPLEQDAFRDEVRCVGVAEVFEIGLVYPGVRSGTREPIVNVVVPRLRVDAAR